MTPNSSPARNAILNARQAMQLGDRQAARDWARRAVELDPDSEQAWLYLAAVSSPRASLYYFEQALKINPDSQPAHKGKQWAEERLKREQPVPHSGQNVRPGAEQPEQASLEDTQPTRKRPEISLQEDFQFITKPAEASAFGDTAQAIPVQPVYSEPKTQPRDSAKSARTASSRKIGLLMKNDEHHRSRILKRFSSHWQNWVGLVLVCFFILVAIAAPLISPNTTRASSGPFVRIAGSKSVDHEPRPPSSAALLGTLPGQYDVFHALVWGTRGALTFGLQVVIFASLFGLLFGAIAGYVGGWVSSLMMRITDAFLAFPIIAGVVFLGQLWTMSIVTMGGIWDRFNNLWVTNPDMALSPIQVLLQAINPLMLTLILFSWMPYARLTNAVVTTLKQTEFIQAARAIGAKPARIILRHLLPNSVTPSIVLAARDIGSMVILQATFTFIGLGGSSIWGQILVMGKDWVLGPGGGILKYWWVYVPATLALILFGVGWNLLGDGLSEVLDPRDD
jgi:peptide/nickel transport system permease protein